ncbi:molybdenum cofactor biosynthesis protein MoaC [candidate division MSBL1 archaeon SCGC-AAA261F19]|uniref:Molybdenum cofactor biosynthesis protein MoaC n=1 Tax=candidate division MSBL1 archaeon SCGC-AAA261F19 TaxID=1698275 RepID=A0A133V9H9_9EURY|nr:molybdenum cofactor biosynthesis protein MoaC [candidate division MSBL1 archaeon SCGC-AAA261F19]
MARMVDVGEKPHVERRAKAEGFIILKPDTVEKIKTGGIPKGDVLTVAKTAGIMAAKRTPEIVPLTHPIPITGVSINFELEEVGVMAEAEVKSRGQTGVEMEALTAVTVALLTVWDMVKGLEKDNKGQYPTVKITDVKVVEKVKK